MMEIDVTYYAMLREQRGCSHERAQTKAKEVGALYDELAARHGLSLARSKLKAARNNEFVAWTTPIQQGDRIEFIPPVAGG